MIPPDHLQTIREALELNRADAIKIKITRSQDEGRGMLERIKAAEQWLESMTEPTWVPLDDFVFTPTKTLTSTAHPSEFRVSNGGQTLTFVFMDLEYELDFKDKRLCRRVDAPDVPQGEALPGLPELRESIRYILDNSIDEYNETFPETQKHLAVLRKVLNEAQPAPAESTD
jgi:hypothetical protein